MNDNSKPSVMIVDDLEEIRSMFGAIVKSLGANIVGEAENGEVALEVFRQHRPDLVLLDIQMPVKNGINTLKEILAEDSAANVVMLTSVSDTMVVDDCIIAGAKDYIRKDLELDVIKQRLESAFAKLK